MSDRSIFLGQRIRRLRKDLGLTQAIMAEDLEISASYIALIENNQRPITAPLLLKLAEIYRVDISTLSRGAQSDFNTQVSTAFKDPLFSDMEISPLDVEDFAASYPTTAEAFLRLYTSYRESQMALADQAGSLQGGSRQLGPDPVSEARRFLAARKNFFLEIDDRAEELALNIKRLGGYERYFEGLRLRVRRLPEEVMAGHIRRYDPHKREIKIDESLDTASSSFQLALQLVYLEMGDVITQLISSGRFDTDSGEKLTRRALANYAAGSVMMPYQAFLKAAEKRLYDVEALGRQFGASYEQVAHRLTTLQKPNNGGVPFFFIRIDAAGNVSKRLDGAGFPFARHGGSCPLWDVHRAFTQPRRLITQWVELPDGERFFSIVRTVTAGGGGYDRPKIERAIALCCSAAHAHKLVYTQGREKEAENATPIGLTCRLCHRSDCLARAEPPMGRTLTVDDYRRPSAPFGLAEG